MNRPSILKYPDEELRKISQPIKVFDDDLKSVVDQLFEVINTQGGIGLSAPQIGVLKRISVVHVPDDEYGPKVYINPVIHSKSAYGIVEESCLSIPEVVANIIRATKINISAHDISGNKIQANLVGMHAVCLQHEIDHLDGKLFIDKLTWPRRILVKNRLKRKNQRTGIVGI